MANFTDLDLYRPSVNDDAKAIMQSVINLLQTQAGERFFSPDSYIGLEELMANLSDDMTLKYYQIFLRERIMEKEPRVKDANIKIRRAEEPNSVYVDITLYFIDGNVVSDTLLLSEGEV